VGALYESSGSPSAIGHLLSHVNAKYNDGQRRRRYRAGVQKEGPPPNELFDERTRGSDAPRRDCNWDRYKSRSGDNSFPPFLFSFFFFFFLLFFSFFLSFPSFSSLFPGTRYSQRVSVSLSPQLPPGVSLIKPHGSTLSLRHASSLSFVATRSLPLSLSLSLAAYTHY